MPVRFARSAARHGISQERVLFVVDHCPCLLYAPPDIDDQRDLVVFLWADAQGVPLEVIGVELDDGDLLLIHAMKMRPRYRDDYARVMECREQ